ncbi:hypothetical protein [Lujinxingia litoralis]|nr:hypothetical protein [Lujinxingia litoralis]
MILKLRTCVERLPRWLRQGRGATASEYMVLLILAALFIVVMIRLFGASVSERFEASRQEIAGISSEQEGGGSAASAYGSGTSETAGASGAGNSAESAEAAAAREARAQGQRPAGKAGSVGGVSWVVIMIVLGLFGLLGYVIFGGKKS